MRAPAVRRLLPPPAAPSRLPRNGRRCATPASGGVRHTRRRPRCSARAPMWSNCTFRRPPVSASSSSSSPSHGGVRSSFRPDLQQHQLVAEIRQELQRAFAALVVQEIRDHDHQAALRVTADELAQHGEEVGRPAGFHGAQRIQHRTEAVPPAGAQIPPPQLVGERVQFDAIQAHHAHVAQRARQAPRVIELAAGPSWNRWYRAACARARAAPPGTFSGRAFRGADRRASSPRADRRHDGNCDGPGTPARRRRSATGCARRPGPGTTSASGGSAAPASPETRGRAVGRSP